MPAPAVGHGSWVCPVLLAGQTPAAGHTVSEPKASYRAGDSLSVCAHVYAVS